METLKRLWNEKPLKIILLAAILIRLVAVIFSKGYGMHDDHFLVIETAQSWLDGADYYNWFKDRLTQDSPSDILNFAYAGIHYLIFVLLESIGINSPQAKMFVVRFLHAAISLPVVIYGYKIAEKLGSKESARKTGLLLALLWFMPFFSVRNLVEVFCLPFLMWAFWLTLKNEYDDKKKLVFLFIGILFGIAFSIRFQTIILAGGVGLVLLFRKRFIDTILIGIGILIPFVLLHGLPDLLIWGYPFAEFKLYVMHNLENVDQYIKGPWYQYILTIVGFIIFPVGLYVLIGLFYDYKKSVIFFIPIILFIIIHSYVLNKQERFILPVLPILIAVGISGWERYVKNSNFWHRNRQLLKASWILFWALNLFLLSFFSTMYSKKARIESAALLSDFPHVEYVVSEDTNNDYASMMPLFYAEKWPQVAQVTRKYPLSELPEYPPGSDQLRHPDFVFFYGNKNLHKRVLDLQKVFPEISYEATFQPGLVDKVMHWLNPVNANHTIYVYRNSLKYPSKDCNDESR